MEVCAPNSVTLKIGISNVVATRMATSNTPGGSIPAFLVHASVPGQISNDVPLFLKWLKSDREYFKKGAAKGGEPDPIPTSVPAEHPTEETSIPAPVTQPRQTLE